ncbi:MAG: SDR family NAD(P)-dependent oxidoreductase [Alphaproteobacteria bacterium]
MTKSAAGRADPVLILGATSGIARALAISLAAAGHPLMLAARPPEALEPEALEEEARQPEALEEEARALERRYGVTVSIHSFDALQTDSIEAFYDQLPVQPSIVVCAVGALPCQVKAAGGAERASKVVASNLLGPALYLEAAARRLVKCDGRTAIVGISSLAGERGRAKNYWYGAGKAGLTVVLSGLRQTYAGTKLLVMTVKPVYVATRMIKGKNTPRWLTETPEAIAERIHQGIIRRRRIVSGRWSWMIMTVITTMPERLFEILPLFSRFMGRKG